MAEHADEPMKSSAKGMPMMRIAKPTVSDNPVTVQAK